MNDLVQEIEKLTVSSRNYTNYSDLPMEMKLECIKHMDFQTKLRLKAVSRTEEKLVNSQKVNLERVYIYKSAEFFKVEVSDGNRKYFISTRTVPIESLIATIGALLRNTDSIRWLELYEHQKTPHSDLLFAELRKCAPMRIAKLHVSYAQDPAIPIALLGLSSTCCDLSEVAMTRQWAVRNESERELEAQLLKVPQLRNAKFIRICWLFDTETRLIPLLIQNWIDTDAPIGRRIESFHSDNRSRFSERFSEQLIFENAEYSRIRMNDEKHIACSHTRESISGMQALRCRIVSASDAWPDGINM